MFPNIRVMIAALLASIAGISCGLGALAAFRVNHQPFTRMQSANPPLQLAFGTGLPDEVTDARPAPFEVRFQVMSWPPPTQSAIPVPSDAPPPAATGAAAKPEDNQQARVESKPAPAEATHPEDDGDITPVLAPVPAPAPVSAIDQSTPPEMAVPENKPATAEAAPVDTVTTAKADDSAAVEPNPGRTASAEKEEAAEPNSSPVTAVPVEKAAPRRVVKLHRKRKPQPAAASAASQNFASPMAQFQWQGSAQETPQTAAPTPQPLKPAIAKRHRPAKNAAARAPSSEQTASSDPAIKAARR
jgi:hypothetical protein